MNVVDAFSDIAPAERAELSHGRGQRKRDTGSLHAVKAQVRNGHLVIDEPTDLPEGTVWKLVLVDSLVDEMDPEERAQFLRELEIFAAEADAGQLVDAEDVLAKLRAPA